MLRLWVLSLVLAARVVAAPPSSEPRLAEAPRAERETVGRMLEASSWPRRAVAAVRLERFRCGESREVLAGLLDDPAWQVRCYAIQSLARRRETADAGWCATESHPRVIRTALRHRLPVDAARLARGVRTLSRSSDPDLRLLGAEIAAASGDPEQREQATAIVRKIILRMDRAEAGAFSSRLARLTGARGLYRPHAWQQWLLKKGRGLTLRPALALDADGPPPPPAGIAALEPERFARLERYIERLGMRAVDLGICLDCTASMSGELTAAQGGIDDLVVFVRDVVASFRFGLVAYRDRHDRFKARGWDFTPDLEVARRRLWQLTAEGGGDTREAVFEALELAYGRLSWDLDRDRERVRVLILVGDAPPHVGSGGKSVELARAAAARGLVTHVIQAEGEDVEHFAALAEAGGGRCVSLEDDDRLIPEIAGLTLGEAFSPEFREFFSMYIDLCR